MTKWDDSDGADRGHIFQPRLRYSSGLAGALWLVGIVAGLAAVFTRFGQRSGERGTEFGGRVWYPMEGYSVAGWVLATAGAILCAYAASRWKGDIRWAAAVLGALPLALMLLMTFGVETR